MIKSGQISVKGNQIKFAKVVFPYGLDKSFDYSFTKDDLVKPGSRVIVDFRGRKASGVVISLSMKPAVKNVKPILLSPDKTVFLGAKHLKLAKELARNSFYSLGEFLYLMIPPVLRGPKNIPIDNKIIEISGFQSKPKKSKKPNGSHSLKNFLIKADSFIQRYQLWRSIVNDKLTKGSVLICFPQYSYLAGAKKIIERDFDGKIFVLTSQQKEADFLSNWQMSRSNALILGTRSSIFYFPSDLQMIVIEEDNSPYYFQEEKPYYNLLGVASLLSSLNNLDIIYSSQNPSLSTFLNLKGNKLQLSEKENLRPDIHVIEASRGRQKGLFSPLLKELLRKKIEEGKKIAVFSIRKGYAPLARCKKCGYSLVCKRCSAYIRVSSSGSKGVCPYCSAEVEVCEICPQCKEGYLKITGVGTERIEAYLRRIFPEVNISLWEEKTPQTQITICTFKLLSFIYSEDKFDAGFLLGADSLLARHDYEAAFNAYDSINKLILFCRESFYVLNLNDSHHFFKNLSLNWRQFYEQELYLRSRLKLPPFGSIVKIVLRSPEEKFLLQKAQILYNTIKKLKAKVYGPFEEYPFKLRGKFRYSIIIKTSKFKSLRGTLRDEIIKLRRNRVKIAVMIR
ncbi:MAG: hypothetical protein ABH872_01205 [Candidatus Omnitrophota bacterium]